ncbi:HSF-type DNA-binding [Seminavis robusta]|uniref:HSF-type DNA-binding n=1 Tax=Seminavis robusta TaxID=568900 RepID=A0A9N8H316_9STRA|nr:HSF-type DNA-binding [Seminavis robusta]|eukprot:Sro78_g042330.1 HSF-type DNA-binding (504) ;mRNA; f:32204-34050
MASSDEESSSPPDEKGAQLEGVLPDHGVQAKGSRNQASLKLDSPEPLSDSKKAAQSKGSELVGTGSKRFPDRLYELLNNEAAPSSLYWLPGGKAFAIEQVTFAKEVLDKYFQATKFASFVRRLHKWGFRRETRGFRKEIGPELSRSVIAFCHDQFQKDDPELVLQMEEAAKKQPPSQKGTGARNSPAPGSPRKRKSSMSSQNSGSSSDLVGEDPRSAQRPRHQAPPVGSERAYGTSAQMIQEAKQDLQQAAVPSVASLQPGAAGGLEANVAPERIADPTTPGQPGRVQTLEHQLLLQNLRSNALQHQDHENALELLLRNQQQSDSVLQRSIITTASLAQQRQLQEHEIQEQQRRAALVAAATSGQGILDNQAFLDADRILQLRRSASASQLGQQLPSLPLAQQNLPGSLLSQLDSARMPQLPPQLDASRIPQLSSQLDPSRLSQLQSQLDASRSPQMPSRDNNSQLMETLLLLELQRQQQQGGQQGAPGQNPQNPNRQFPPFR